jgi:hypothetical protein
LISQSKLILASYLADRRNFIGFNYRFKVTLVRYLGSVANVMS